MAGMARFYKLVTHDPDEGAQLSWHRRHKDALAALAQAREEADERGDSIEPCSLTKVAVELSTDGLIRWLNIHLTTDNG